MQPKRCAFQMIDRGREREKWNKISNNQTPAVKANRPIMCTMKINGIKRKSKLVNDSLLSSTLQRFQIMARIGSTRISSLFLESKVLSWYFTDGHNKPNESTASRYANHVPYWSLCSFYSNDITLQGCKREHSVHTFNFPR